MSDDAKRLSKLSFSPQKWQRASVLCQKDPRDSAAEQAAAIIFSRDDQESEFTLFCCIQRTDVFDFISIWNPITRQKHSCFSLHLFGFWCRRKRLWVCPGEPGKAHPCIQRIDEVWLRWMLFCKNWVLEAPNKQSRAPNRATCVLVRGKVAMLMWKHVRIAAHPWL